MSDETWEYHRESLGGLFRSYDIERRVDDLLNRMGRDGWELITSNRFWLTRRYAFVFKRRVLMRTASRNVA